MQIKIQSTWHLINMELKENLLEIGKNSCRSYYKCQTNLSKELFIMEEKQKLMKLKMK